MKQSAGLLVYRKTAKGFEVLLAHPGGPFWARKDSWSIPKGEASEGEELLTAARREYQEETGFDIPTGQAIELGSAKQSSSKINHIWAVESEPDLSKFVCKSYVEVEWPPKSGQQEQFPEVDQLKWFSPDKAKQKLFKYQVEFVDHLAEKLNIELPEPPQQTSLL